MAPFIGEIRVFGGNFAPQGWLLCDGGRLQISQYDALFNLIGTMYGGDGVSTFQLPDLRGRVPVYGQIPGSTGGSETVTLNTNTMPMHTHLMSATVNTATQASPQGMVPAAVSGPVTNHAYGGTQPYGAIDPSSITPAGGGQPHANIQPYLCVTFIIAYQGIYPSQ